MNEWQIYPAIDLRRGRVVRLKQGDPARETVFDDDPVAVAQRWREVGASWLHVVNLDGAFGEGDTDNHAALESILGTEVRVQFGGGLRDLESLQRVVDLGVSRAIVGTAAVQDPALLEAALNANGPERLAVAIDARHGRVRTHGWQQDSDLSAAELARRCAGLGVRWIIHTDVARDGMGRGLNVKASRQLARESARIGTMAHPLSIIASGGVASLDDIRQTYDAGLSGVIIGRALYDGSIRLDNALRVGRMGNAS